MRNSVGRMIQSFFFWLLMAKRNSYFLKLYLEGTFFILTNRKAGEIININILQFLNLKFIFAERVLTRRSQAKSNGFIFRFCFVNIRIIF